MSKSRLNEVCAKLCKALEQMTVSLHCRMYDMNRQHVVPETC